MKVAGIIAEYNPIHEGHAYHIRCTREMSGADVIIAAMSGSVCQRGIPAFFDKFSRAEAAIRSGADLVVELPAAVSAASAEYFSKGGVSLLKTLGCGTLSFGSEAGSLSALNMAAEYLSNETGEFSEAVKKSLSEGLNYPSAVSKAAGDKADILRQPNNTLGIEYLKAIRSVAPEMTPMTVKREGLSYHDGDADFKGAASNNSLSGCNSSAYPSSSMIRSRIISADPQYDEFYGKKHLVNDDFSGLLYGRISGLAESGAPCVFTEFADINKDLSNRLYKLSKQPCTFSELSNKLKHKQLTQARINRCLWHILLGIKTPDQDAVNSAAFPGYIRVLAHNEAGAKYLKEAKKELNEKAGPVIITRPARDIKLLSDEAKRSFSLDLNAYRIYREAYYLKYNVALPDEMTYSIKII